MMRVRAAVCVLACLVVAMVSSGVASPSAAEAEVSGPGWLVSSVAEPTNFSSADNAQCAAVVGNRFCDRYMVTVTNVGGSGTTGPIRIVDTLPPGLRPVGISAQNFKTEEPLNCSLADATCVYGGTVEPGGTIGVKVEVEVLSAADVVTNAVRVEGGGAASAATGAPSTGSNTVDASPAGFGVADFGMQVSNIGGTIDGQAADHPNDLTTVLNLNSGLEYGSDGSKAVKSVQPPRDIIVTLPLGFVGNPLAASQCTAVQLTGGGGELSQCPPSSRLGNVILFGQGVEVDNIMPSTSELSELDNMVPEKGFPAEFGFKVYGKNVSLYPSVIRTRSGYALRVNSPGITRTVGIEGFGLTFFGDPNTTNGEPSNPQAFFTNPSNCGSGQLTAKLETDSWAEPGVWKSAEDTMYPSIGGCSLLQYEPTVEMTPEVTEAEAPSGFEVKIKTPQSPNRFPVLATPDLKNLTMTLPEGMTVSPGAADGLVGCPATGEHGIDMPEGVDRHPNEAGEGEEIGADGLSHLSAGHCPLASQIGEVEIKTPLLKDALTGHVYLAQPQCGGEGQPECTAADATNGRLYGLYLEAEGSGIVIKLAGKITANPTTGQLTTSFTELPQQPVSEVTVRLKGGARAPLANPRQCGSAATNVDLTPWGAPIAPDAISTVSYQVDWNGGECPGTAPFAPTLSAGTLSTSAGRFAPFTLTVARADRNQDLARLQVHTPPGLIGMLSSVAQCPEPQASLGACPAASEIGKTAVAVGSGSHPFVVNGGQVFLTGPYKGAPFGLSIVVPAKAGPFNLGNVVVRSAISIDPGTSALTVTSDPLPQFRDGVPLRIQTLNVTIDRPGFMFNPTNCAPKQVTAGIEAQQGASANVASSFAVEGCKSLPFKPSFKVSTRGKASKASGASLSVSVSSKGGPQTGGGEANIKSVRVELPKQLPARLTTLQKACVAKVFEANPAACPKESDVGSARAVTPVLAHPLIGPAYLVSHGGAAFPDLEVVLQGEGIVLVLDGQTNIKRGITSSDFAMVPDAPVSSFSLTLPQGKFSALTSNVPAKARFSLCGQTLKMPTIITGQNGAVVKQSTRISVTGCPRAKKAARHKTTPKHQTVKARTHR